MTEPSSAEADTEIEHIGDSPVPDADTDFSEAPVFEPDKLEAFDPSTGWPEPGFELVAFPGSGPQLDEGVS
jgi:hypothetical protein